MKVKACHILVSVFSLRKIFESNIHRSDDGDHVGTVQ